MVNNGGYVQIVVSTCEHCSFLMSFFSVLVLLRLYTIFKMSLTMFGWLFSRVNNPQNLMGINILELFVIYAFLGIPFLFIILKSAVNSRLPSQHTICLCFDFLSAYSPFRCRPFSYKHHVLYTCSSRATYAFTELRPFLPPLSPVN